MTKRGSPEAAATREGEMAPAPKRQKSTDDESGACSAPAEGVSKVSQSPGEVSTSGRGAEQSSSKIPVQASFPVPATGERIQVQWDVHDSFTGGSIATWWGASIVGSHGRSTMVTVDEKLSEPVSPGQYAVYKILYDAQDGFAVTESNVCFVSTSYVYDCGEKCFLFWRREDTSLKNSSTSASGISQEISMTMKDLVKDQNRLDAEQHGGHSLESLGMAALGRLNYLQQANAASHFRDFADNVKERLKGLIEKHGPGYTVTAADIRSIMEGV